MITLLTADKFRLVPQCLQPRSDLLAVVALNLDFAIFHCAAGSAMLLEFGAQPLERLRVVVQAADDGGGFALAPFAVAPDAGDLPFDWKIFGGGFWLGGGVGGGHGGHTFFGAN